MEKSKEINSSVSSLCLSFVMILRQLAHMFILETRLASISFLNILGLAFIIVILIFSAWLCLLASMSLWLTQAGISWPIVLFAIANLNLLLILPCYWLLCKFKGNLSFPATRRQLQETARLSTSEPL